QAADVAVVPQVEDSTCAGRSAAGEAGEAAAVERVRMLLAARPETLPLYVQEQGARVGKSGDCLKVEVKGQEVREVRLLETSQVCLFGGVQISTQAVQELLSRGIPVSWLSHGGWFYGMTQGLAHKNIELRRRQFAAAADQKRSLAFARGFVGAKIRNCRTLLRRNCEEADAGLLRALRQHADEAEQAGSMESLLGIEGNAARLYFGAFPRMLKAPDGQGVPAFSLEGRNRRPPRDPVNALLSFAYALLAKDLHVTLQAVGFEPLLGFYHQPRYGRPALALDLMEELRPIVADSVVITAINNREVQPDDFAHRAGAVSLSPAGRKRFLQAYERRMDQLITHPVFGYRLSYRRVLEVQARLLGRALAGEIPSYPSFTTR
ncbi:MAG: CRISPR-associated endonuclease Cas1, partial [Deltaproteobacteria bacterium]|nr:CRISPR-associated endonuclease Cas1 [Deltaproteobacteria bacterium]